MEQKGMSKYTSANKEYQLGNTVQQNEENKRSFENNIEIQQAIFK